MKKVTIILIVLMIVVVGFLSGCETGAKDTDNDSYPDDKDAFPNNPSEWIDSDKDGIGDNSDTFPQDASETKDSDNDGVGDNSDKYPNNSNEQHDSDNDGVGNNADKFPYDSTQSVDRDGDGYGDNPTGSNPDTFPDDKNEWKDSDNDGIGDNADIYDNGNGAVKVQITKYIGDNYAEAYPESGTSDPYFHIVVYSYFESKETEIQSEDSNFFIDAGTLSIPFSYVFDVDDDVSKPCIGIQCKDEDTSWNDDEIDEFIDINSDLKEYMCAECFDQPIKNIIQATNDGKTDLQENQRDAYIEYTIQIVGI